MKLFVGAMLNDRSLLAQKVLSFKNRYENSSFMQAVFQLPMIASFDLHQSKVKDFEMDLEDLIEGHFAGSGHLDIEFISLEFLQGKKDQLFLRPELSDDFYHFRESLYHLCKEYGCINLKQSFQFDKIPFVRLGKFNNPLFLNLAIAEAREEFIFPFKCRVESFIVFEKFNSMWRKNCLFSTLQSENCLSAIREEYYTI